MSLRTPQFTRSGVLCVFTAWLLAGIALSSGNPSIAAPPPRAAEAKSAGVVTISVQPAVAASRSEITIGEVATVEGGDAALRNRIAGLDLADAPEVGKTTRLKHEVIAYRIRIAGIDAKRYRIQGSDSVTVSAHGYRVPEQEIVGAAKAYLLARLPWNAADVTIEPSRPIKGPIQVSGGKEDIRLEASLRAPQVSLGTVRVDVVVLTGGAKQTEVPVFLELHHHQTVAVASRRVERGQPLTSDDVYFERRVVDTVSGYLTESENPVGQRTKRAILPLQSITKTDLDSAETETAVVIRQRDVVKIVVRAGNLVVSTNGEALQDGRTGQSIRVRNVDSKTVVVGRVMNRNEVQVLY